MLIVNYYLLLLIFSSLVNGHIVFFSMIFFYKNFTHVHQLCNIYLCNWEYSLFNAIIGQKFVQNYGIQNYVIYINSIILNQFVSINNIIFKCISFFKL